MLNHEVKVSLPLESKISLHCIMMLRCSS